MTFNFRPLLLWTLLPLAVGSCQYLRESFGMVPQKPYVSVKEIQVRSFNLREFKLKVKLSVQNPNAYNLEFSNLNYQVSLNEQIVATGLLKETFNFPPEKSVDVELPLTLTGLETLQVIIQSFQKQKALIFGLNGSVRFHSALGDMTVNFNHRKNLLKDSIGPFGRR